MRTSLFFILLIWAPSIVAQQNLQSILKDQRIPKGELLILIDKSKYTLEVYHKQNKLISYPCVFGFNPIDDKQFEGDGCTPEGDFKIRSMYPHKRWKYFIWIDYPNKESWRRFNKRKSDGTIGKSERIGGEIGIHGVPDGADNMIPSKTNWTLGCISLKNSDITDLYKSIDANTKIHIDH